MTALKEVDVAGTACMKPTRFEKFVVLLVLVGGSYLIDCFVARHEHPELAWFQRGVLALYPFAFPTTVLLFAVGLYFVLRKSP